jgi:hypothetical protein
MKKILGIVLLSLLLANNALSEEIVLRCDVNECSGGFAMNQRFTLVVNLEKKELYIDDKVHNIEIINDKIIVSDARHGQKIKLHRYDGYFYFDYDLGQLGEAKIEGFCKKFERIF